MRTKDQYVAELAQTVKTMFSNGQTDPSAAEIATEHFPERALGGEIIEGIRKRLHQVRDLLETDHELLVCLLSKTYYTRYRHDPPTTTADARRCLPVGHGKPQVGIHLQTGPDDMIWQAMLSLNLAGGAGKMKKSADRTLDAVDDKRLSEPRAKELLTEASRRAAPRDLALQKRVMQALPSAIDEDTSDDK